MIGYREKLFLKEIVYNCIQFPVVINQFTRLIRFVQRLEFYYSIMINGNIQDIFKLYSYVNIRKLQISIVKITNFPSYYFIIDIILR